MRYDPDEMTAKWYENDQDPENVDLKSLESEAGE